MIELLDLKVIVERTIEAKRVEVKRVEVLFSCKGRFPLRPYRTVTYR
jgi:hypothetical protein